MATNNNLSNVIFPIEPMYREGTMTLPWIRFFNNLFERVGGYAGVNLELVDTSITPIYGITGSPITSMTGKFDLHLTTQAANKVFAGPLTSTAQPTFRSLVNADLPLSGVTAGEYGQVTVNAEGIITVGTT